MDEFVVGKLCNRMADRAEIVDQHPIIDLEPLVDQRRADDPRIVGELDQLIVDRRGDRDPRGAGKRPAKLTLRGAPREMKVALLNRKRGGEGKGVGVRWK